MKDTAKLYIVRIADILGGRIGDTLKTASYAMQSSVEQITEIRIRANQPLQLSLISKAVFVSKSGLPCKAADGLLVSKEEIAEIVARLCRHSRYAYTEEMKQGFLTLSNGHRVGLAGKVIADGTMTEILSLNIRVAHSVYGAASEVMPYIIRGENDIYSTLVISPPACGKTTLIREIARTISDGDAELHFTGGDVGIIDERSELSCGEVLGLRTDVYEGVSKVRGIQMMLRCMSPSVICTDELGGVDDMDAVREAMNAGIRFVATMHGYGLNDGELRPSLRAILQERLFERYIVLSRSAGAGTVELVTDGERNVLYERGQTVKCIRRLS